VASFNTFFHGQLSGLEITCLQSFLDHGHAVTIYCYEDCGAPPHFRLADAASVVPLDEVFYYDSGPGRGSIAGFANRFRYALLRRTEQWWIDTDVACLSSRWPVADRMVVAGWQDDTLINNAVLHLKREFATILEEEAAACGKGLLWGQTGPMLLTKHVQQRNLNTDMLPISMFYPMHYSEWFKPFIRQYTVDILERCSQSMAIHFWNEMIRRSSLKTAMLPDPRSFIGMLVAKHKTAVYFTSL
jgi:hypothetical protein